MGTRNMIHYLTRIGDALSQLLNAALFGGHPNESISGLAWRENRPWRPWIDRLLWFDKDHCRNAYENDLAYARRLTIMSNPYHRKESI